MSAVHVEGMGWLGSVLARRLFAVGVPFTWSDPYAEHSAWGASTGLVYPAGDARSARNLELWRGWVARRVLRHGEVEPAAFCFAHKRPPHGGSYAVAADLGWIRVAGSRCYAVNVARVVKCARAEFAAERVSAAPRRARRIVAHGFNDRLAGVAWGWSARVRLDVDEELRQRIAGRRALAFAGQAHRFLSVHAHPIPGLDGWWNAGSSIVRQRRPKRCDAHARLGAWLDAVPGVYGGRVQVLDVREPVHGWRPWSRDDDAQGLQETGGALVFPPLRHSGVRWAPELVEAAVEWARRPR